MNSVVVRFNPQDLFKFSIYTEKTLLLQKGMTKLVIPEAVKNLPLFLFLQGNDLFLQIFWEPNTHENTSQYNKKLNLLFKM